MAKTAVADVIIPTEFEKYAIERTAELSRFGESGIIEMAPEFDALAQGGGREVKMPFWKDLTANRQLLSDAASLQVNKIAADTDIARIHNDGQVWRPEGQKGSLQRSSMAKPLHLSRPSRRVTNVVRTWLAMRSQKLRRRRAVAGAGLPVAVITGAEFGWDITEPGWADVTLYWTADTSGWSGGSFEVWCQIGEAREQLVGTAWWSDRAFEHVQASDGENTLVYRLRFRNGSDVGAFSDTYAVEVSV